MNEVVPLDLTRLVLPIELVSEFADGTILVRL